MRDLAFHKMQATGNDFIVLDEFTSPLPLALNAELVKKLCDRRRGIGADGLILLKEQTGADFGFKFFNADGSLADLCGNGARAAFAYFIAHYGKGRCAQFSMGSNAGVVLGQKKEDGIEISLPDPHGFEEKTLSLTSKRVTLSFLNTGVPHAVLFEEKGSDEALFNLGQAIRFHPAFGKEGANVNFVSEVECAQRQISLLTYERGVEDFTLACGTGAVASALATSVKHKLISPVRVCCRGGTLEISFEKDAKGCFQNVRLFGEVSFVFKGIFFL